MANRFWVGSGSANTWAATTPTNWATTSGGSNNASVPTTTDVAIFDSNSGTGNSVIGASTTVQGLDCTGGTGSYAGTITHNTGVTLTINTGAASSLRFSAGMTYTPASTSSLITFSNTTGTAQLTSAGKAFAAITMNGVGGTCQQQDALNINAITNSILTVTNGIWDCNSQTLTACSISLNNSNTRSFLAGGTITLGGNVTAGSAIWNCTTTTGLTFTKNSANIIILSPSSPIQSISFAGGGLTYNGLTLNNTTNNTLFTLTGANTFSSWAVGFGWSISLPTNTTTTILTAPTWVGTPANPIGFSNIGNAVQVSTISVPSGTVTLKWGSLFAVTASGGATFTATNTLNLGTVSGWAITPPADSALTPGGIATAVWQDLLASGDFTTASSVGALLAAMANLQYTVPAIGRGTVTTGGSTTSVPTSAFAPATSASVANQLAGRVVLFDAATTTVALRGQVATISASSASATPTLTVSALTATPASGDTFSVL